MPTKNKFESVELDWAEKQLTTWMKYVDDNPFHEMKDRIKLKETKNGGVIPIPIATIEQQQKSIRDTIKDYLQLYEVVKKLRIDGEAASQGTYGDVKVSKRMEHYDKQGRKEEG